MGEIRRQVEESWLAAQRRGDVVGYIVTTASSEAGRFLEDAHGDVFLAIGKALDRVAIGFAFYLQVAEQLRLVLNESIVELPCVDAN